MYYAYQLTKRLLMSLALGATLVACQPSPLQTVETGELFLPEQDPKYQFTRNQESSVDTQEPDLLRSTLNELHDRFLDQAQIRNQELMNTAQELFDLGLYGYAPKAYIAQSRMHQAHREQILADLNALIETTARLSGLGAPNPSQHRRREAEPMRSGYVDGAVGGRLVFVDEHGLVVARAFAAGILGAINLDQILNVHLDDPIVQSQELERDHENQILIKGNNYTALEHHWDLAYGYYLQGLRSLALSDGIQALRGTARRLDLAFTLGRIDINYHLYDMLPKHVQTIRQELKRVWLIRLEHLLLGGNTLANLSETPTLAFSMLSEAYGMIYSLQFLCSPEGKPYFTYQEVRDLQAQLISGKGLWKYECLNGDNTHIDNLQTILQTIKTKLNVK
ncbi:MAG: DUF4856 domain-containing protein [Porphyromonadaceae bacterium]|nr:DUF4856 domain-containing protein [Porphyromonadaceae bacterium]